MECVICGKTITGKRPDSIYCSAKCRNKAKQIRATKRYLDELKGLNEEKQEEQVVNRIENINTSDEIRTIEKENFNTLWDLKSNYDEKIKELENKNIQKDFKIERLQDKIEDLKEKHREELDKASNNTTKEVVSSISQMPAIQTALGALATNVIPSKGELNGVDNGLSVQEQQIIDSIRRMQPDTQSFLVQMLYVLFAKPYEEQVQIFDTLKTYMLEPEEEEEP